MLTPSADVQAYLNGVENPVFKNFFTVKTFVAKVIGSSLAVGSSLIMGKEGPMLHAGSILAVILGEAWCAAQQQLLYMHPTPVLSQAVHQAAQLAASCFTAQHVLCTA